MKEKYITGVVKLPGEEAKLMGRIENSLEALQNLVEGYIETVTMDDCEAYECDEDALNAEHCDSCVMNRLLDLGV